MLLPKEKKSRKVQPLRDPVSRNLLPFFLVNAGSPFVYQKDLRIAQRRITYTILYHVGLRLNEIRELTEKQIMDAIAAAQFSIIYYKTRPAYNHILSKTAIQDLKNLKTEYIIVFEKYQYKYLFGKLRPVDQKTLIRTINKDLKNTSQKANLPYNLKSHSFRINMITRLLQNTSVQDAADIIGHRDIKSTMAYKQYALNKTEIQNLLNKIDQQSYSSVIQ